MFNLNKYKELIKKSKVVNLEEMVNNSELVIEVDKEIKKSLEKGQMKIVLPSTLVSTLAAKDSNLCKYDAIDIINALNNVMIKYDLPSEVTKLGLISIDFNKIESHDLLSKKDKLIDLVNEHVNTMNDLRRNIILSINDTAEYDNKELIRYLNHLVNKEKIESYKVQDNGDITLVRMK